MDERIASTARLANRWKVTKKTIRTWSWLKPARVGRGQYDETTAHNLFIEHRIMPQFSRPEGQESASDAKRRKEIAVANLKELDEAEKRGALVPKAQAVDWLVALVSEAKSVLLAIPRRMALVLSADGDPRSVENKLRREIYHALTKLAEGKKR